LAFPFVLLAQAPTSNPAVPTLKVTTHLVVLNVVVTDKKGKPVTNLSKDDFSVLENGQPQTISTFEPAAQPGGAEGAQVVPPDFVPAAALQNGTRPRTIIVLDELNTVSEDTMFAKQKMRQFLLAQPAVLRQPTSIYLLTKRRLEQFAAPTRDRDSLLAKPSKMSLELPPHDLDSGSVQGGADRLPASLLALDEIALSTAEQKTRKNVIWIGNGIPILSASGVSLGDSERFKNWVHYTANWLEETQTTVYTIDPRGLEAAEVGIYNDTGRYIVPTPDLTPSELLFESIAPESGGAIMRGRNDIDVAIGTAVRDGNSYYTLSYYPTDRNWDGNFRKIRIQLEPAGLIARTQRGYYAYADGFQNGAGQVEFGLSRAVTSPLPFRSVAFAATG
jgi:VWFA-related protein